MTINQAVVKPKINSFERNLTWWVLSCILVGITLGELAPSLFQVIALIKLAEVNLPVAVLIWLMIIPMLLKIDFAAMSEVIQHAKGIGVTLFVNWLVKPFSMALLAWLFIRQLFAGMLPAEQIDSYIARLILLAAAPCTAMVFVWSSLCNGDAKFTLSQVAINDAIMLIAFAPIVALLLGLSSIIVPWDTLVISVLLFIVAPVIVSQIFRKFLLKIKGISTEAFYSKSWDNLPVTPDIVITVCGNAAGETCPIYLGKVIRAHWGVSDPAKTTGTEAEINAVFENTYLILRKRIEAFLAIDIKALDNLELIKQLTLIGCLL